MNFHSSLPSRDTFVKEHMARYEFASRFVKGKCVLDIACGIGYGSYFLLKQGAKKVAGGDLDREPIREANYYREQELEFALMDASRLPFKKDTFDVVVSLETIEHVPNYVNFLQDCHRCMVEGGTIILSTPNKALESPRSSRSSHFYHAKEFSVSEIGELLKQYFSEHKLYGQDKNLFFASIGKVLRPLVLCTPNISKIIEFCSSIALGDYGHAKLGRETMNALVDRKYEPYPLTASSSPFHIIAVATK